MFEFAASDVINNEDIVFSPAPFPTTGCGSDCFIGQSHSVSRHAINNEDSSDPRDLESSFARPLSSGWEMEFPDFLRGVPRFVPPYSPVTNFPLFLSVVRPCLLARLFIPSPTV